MPLQLLINGAKGRMGQALIACAKEFSELGVGGSTDAGDDFAAALAKCGACVDFSHHSALETVLAGCVAGKKTLVIGTTGISDAGVNKIREASKQIPIVYSGNY